MNDAARTRPDLRPPFASTDSSTTTPYLRIPEAGYAGASDEAPPASALPPVSKTQAELRLAHELTLERAREIHARLRASNVRPPSLERLAKRLGETEAKLKALHGNRTVTFDVVLKDCKAVVKPIVH